MNTPFNLQRFLDAQQRDYVQALREIKNGQKQGHWIWYIFPKLKGFGGSSTAKYYGLDGIEEARAYYDHPVLRERLIEITTALLEHKDKSAVAILSPIDARKVKSCMTLFWLVSENLLFKSVLDAFYEEEMDNKAAKMFGVAKSGNRNNNQINTPMRNNPFTLEQLDYMIVSKIRKPALLCLSEDDENIVSLYNFFGRWFPKEEIVLRMLDIEKIKEDQEGQEGQSALAYRRIPTYMDAAFVQRVKKELDEIWNRGKENKDDSPTIDINSEIFVEINNLSHFNEAYKVRALMKYIVPKHLGGNYLFLRAIHIGKMDGSVYEGMPNTILLFWWEHNNIPNIICYISTSNNTQFSCPFVTNAFHIDISDIDDNDFEDDSYGWYCYLSKEQYLNDIINYSGSDYTPMFRMVGEHITCCNPPLIRHKYRLGSLRIPYNNMSSEYVEKYYDLYHSGNWNAKHAIERGGFNLNG